MIVLDTNVLSELMRPRPASWIMEWLGDQQAESAFVTTVTQAELLDGVAVLPAGRRREQLRAAVAGML